MSARMYTSRSLLCIGPSAVRPFRARPATFSARARPAHFSPRAAATLTPASVVTSTPDLRSEETESGLGFMGKALIQQAEVFIRIGRVVRRAHIARRVAVT